VPGETVPINSNDEASVFTAGSLLTAQNGFTGYWQGPDLGSFTEPYQGTDSDFIQVSVTPGQHYTYTAVADLLLITGRPYDVPGQTVDYALPEVQILAITAWQEVLMPDGSLAYVAVADGVETSDDVLADYEHSILANTSFQIDFDAEAAHYQGFVGSGMPYQIQNGESVYLDTFDGYETTGRYFIEVVTVQIDPTLVTAIAGADIHPNGRYVLMNGESGVETLENGFRTYAWGDGWLQRIPYGTTTPTPPSGALLSHILTTDDHSSLSLIGKSGDPAGEDVKLRVFTPAGAASVSGIIDVDATAIGGEGTAQGGSGTVIYDAVAYSGTDITLLGRAQGGNGPTPGIAQAEISGSLFSMGLAAAMSKLTLDLSATGGNAAGGSRGSSTIVFDNNSVSGWGGIDLITLKLGRTGEDASVAITDNSFILGANNDRLTIVVNGNGPLTVTSTNQFQGGDGFDILAFDVESGIDFSIGLASSAFVTGFEVLRGGRGGDTLTGSGDSDYLQGEAGNDEVSGASGNDVIDGGAGNDILDGGIDGSDTVTFEQLELATDGVTVTSRAVAGITVSLASGTATGAGSDTLSNFENVRGTLFADTITGDEHANVLNGLQGSDTLSGGGGDDTLIGGQGDDTLIGGNGFDTADYSSRASTNLFEPAYNVSGAVQIDLRILQAQDTGGAGFDRLSQIENLIGTAGADTLVGDEFANYFVGGGGSDTLSGNGSSDTLEGNAGNDRLDGGSGADAMNGGSGDDVYIVDNVSDIVIETAPSGGIDTVTSSVTFTLSVNVENLTLAGTAAINGTGNVLANTLVGNSGANVLDGGAGNDTMSGGLGSDTYVVDSARDTIFENAGEGIDSVRSSASYTLGANLENLTLIGAASIDGSGNALANMLTGNAQGNKLSGGAGADVLQGQAGNDGLDGGTGSDKMYGGVGDDTYTVDNVGDLVYENAGEGTDTVICSVALYLRANVENLTLTGTSGIFGKGNDLANVLTGNGAGNRLSGAGGNDTIVGNGGRDTLDGGTGNDTMVGGADNDVYIVDSSADVIVENAGEGTDFVRASASFTLSANVDRMYLVGSADINGTGNALANLLVGNTGNNQLSGMGANDRLFGGLGNDTLNGGDGNDYLEGGAGLDVYTGGAGRDYFVFRGGDTGSTLGTADRITDFATGDRISLGPIDADTTSAGNQAFTFVGSGTFTGAAGELRYEQIGGNTFVTGDIDGDRVADLMIRLDGLHTIGAPDLLL
jgi:Ca2+-binding RTX toxin-like protein